MNILVAVPFNSEQRSHIESAAPESTFIYEDRHAVTAEQVAEADVVIGNVAPELLTGMRHLKLLQLNSAGYDDYLAANTLPAETALTSASGAYGQAVSEHMLAMLLALMKRLHSYRDDQAAHIWSDHGAVTTPVGAEVLVLGAGDIGGHFATLMAALGSRVTGVQRHRSEPRGGFHAMTTVDELPDLLPAADVVTCILPSTPATIGLADDAFFGAMKPGALFLNGGRGDLVVEDALVGALASGHLAGAAIDVTSPEPLPQESPLWDAPNLLLTPHVSGGFHLPAVLDNIADIAADNLRRLKADETLRNLVER